MAEFSNFAQDCSFLITRSTYKRFLQLRVVSLSNPSMQGVGTLVGTVSCDTAMALDRDRKRESSASISRSTDSVAIRFWDAFKDKSKSLTGMLHVPALPGSPPEHARVRRHRRLGPQGCKGFGRRWYRCADPREFWRCSLLPAPRTSTYPAH